VDAHFVSAGEYSAQRGATPHRVDGTPRAVVAVRHTRTATSPRLYTAYRRQSMTHRCQDTDHFVWTRGTDAGTPHRTNMDTRHAGCTRTSDHRTPTECFGQSDTVASTWIIEGGSLPPGSSRRQHTVGMSRRRHIVLLHWNAALLPAAAADIPRATALVQSATLMRHHVSEVKQPVRPR
jgi:hypothetical protein